jgi:hypothetical protein
MIFVCFLFLLFGQLLTAECAASGNALRKSSDDIHRPINIDGTHKVSRQLKTTFTTLANITVDNTTYFPGQNMTVTVTKPINMPLDDLDLIIYYVSGNTSTVSSNLTNRIGGDSFKWHSSSTTMKYVTKVPLVKNPGIYKLIVFVDFPLPEGGSEEVHIGTSKNVFRINSPLLQIVMPKRQLRQGETIFGMQIYNPYNIEIASSLDPYTRRIRGLKVIPRNWTTNQTEIYHGPNVAEFFTIYRPGSYKFAIFDCTFPILNNCSLVFDIANSTFNVLANTPIITFVPNQIYYRNGDSLSMSLTTSANIPLYNTFGLYIVKAPYVVTGKQYAWGEFTNTNGVVTRNLNTTVTIDWDLDDIRLGYEDYKVVVQLSNSAWGISESFTVTNQ